MITRYWDVEHREIPWDKGRFIMKRKEGIEPGFNLYDLAVRLRVRGCQVPASSLPANCEDLAIQRSRPSRATMPRAFVTNTCGCKVEN